MTACGHRAVSLHQRVFDCVYSNTNLPVKPTYVVVAHLTCTLFHADPSYCTNAGMLADTSNKLCYTTCHPACDAGNCTGPYSYQCGACKAGYYAIDQDPVTGLNGCGARLCRAGSSSSVEWDVPCFDAVSLSCCGTREGDAGVFCRGGRVCMHPPSSSLHLASVAYATWLRF